VLQSETAAALYDKPKKKKREKERRKERMTKLMKERIQWISY
jgi:hypothetical protein